MRLRLCAKMPSERAVMTETRQAVVKACWKSLLDVDGMAMIVGHPLLVWYCTDRGRKSESFNREWRRVARWQLLVTCYLVPRSFHGFSAVIPMIIHKCNSALYFNIEFLCITAQWLFLSDMFYTEKPRKSTEQYNIPNKAKRWRMIVSRGKNTT